MVHKSKEVRLQSLFLCTKLPIVLYSRVLSSVVQYTLILTLQDYYFIQRHFFSNPHILAFGIIFSIFTQWSYSFIVLCSLIKYVLTSFYPIHIRSKAIHIVLSTVLVITCLSLDVLSVIIFIEYIYIYILLSLRLETIFISIEIVQRLRQSDPVLNVYIRTWSGLGLFNRQKNWSVCFIVQCSDAVRFWSEFHFCGPDRSTK